MAIPYGLLGQTDVEKKKRGPFKKGEGYWLGSQYVFPEVGTSPPVGMAPPPQQPLFTPISTPAPQPQGGILGSGWTGGDGGAGNGVGGGPSPSAQAGPDFSESGHVNAPDPTTSQGLPSLPSFQEQAPAPTAPAPGLAPAPDLKDMAVSEVDPQGPSGVAAGKGTSSTGKSANATPSAAQAAAIAAVDQAIAADQANANKGVPTTGFIDAVKGITSKGIDFGITPDMAENAAGARQERSNDLPSVSQNFADHPSVTGKSATGTGGENNGGTQGGIGATGNPGPGNDTSGTAAADAGGSWRHGGQVHGDGDGRLEPVSGTLHEGDFAQSPEATSYYGPKFMAAINERLIPKKAALGLLASALDKPQSKKIDRGLLRL